MKIICPRPILLNFRRECRKCFPLEHLGALYGQRSDEGNVLITDIVPLATGTDSLVTVHKHVISRSKRSALRKEKDWLGTIHSHCSQPNDETCWHLSKADIKSALQWGETVCGVVFVDEEGARSEVHWYVPSPIPEVLYFKPSSDQ